MLMYGLFCPHSGAVSSVTTSSAFYQVRNVQYLRMYMCKSCRQYIFVYVRTYVRTCIDAVSSCVMQVRTYVYIVMETNQFI